VKIKVTLHETESFTGAPYNIKDTVCHTAEDYAIMKKDHDNVVLLIKDLQTNFVN